LGLFLNSGLLIFSNTLLCFILFISALICIFPSFLIWAELVFVLVFLWGIKLDFYLRPMLSCIDIHFSLKMSFMSSHKFCNVVSIFIYLQVFFHFSFDFIFDSLVVQEGVL
jgi:hypothetical protein